MTWINVKEYRPDCKHECTTDDCMVSNSVFIMDTSPYASVGIGHMREDGTWKVYGGDYDFMHVEEVTHWMPFPQVQK